MDPCVIVNGYKFPLVIKRDGYHRIKASFKNNTVIVNAYYTVSEKEIKEFLENNEKKLTKYIVRMMNNTVKDSINVMSKKYTIKDSGICCVDGDIIYNNDKPNIKYYCANYFYEDLYRYLKEKTAYYYKLMYKDNNIPTISVVNVKTYYGQYNKLKHHIKYNICLMFNDLDVIDSVIVHELSHIKYMNHQKEFYDLVKLVLPNYDSLHNKLKKEGLSL